jgi:hypothetical protein
VVVGRATRCAWIHSSHGAAKSMAPLVMNQRVDLGSSWKAIGSCSCPLCASSARDHSTCRFFELSCTALSSNACSCASANSAHLSVSVASHSSEPPLPKGPCATCGSSRASMISLDFSSGALSCAITAPPLLMAAGRVVPANDKGEPALKAVADPTSIAAKTMAFW